MKLGGKNLLICIMLIAMLLLDSRVNAQQRGTQSTERHGVPSGSQGGSRPATATRQGQGSSGTWSPKPDSQPRDRPATASEQPKARNLAEAAPTSGPTPIPRPTSGPTPIPRPVTTTAGPTPIPRPVTTTTAGPTPIPRPVTTTTGPTPIPRPVTTGPTPIPRPVTATTTTAKPANITTTAKPVSTNTTTATTIKSVGPTRPVSTGPIVTGPVHREAVVAPSVHRETVVAPTTLRRDAVVSGPTVITRTGPVIEEEKCEDHVVEAPVYVNLLRDAPQVRPVRLEREPVIYERPAPVVIERPAPVVVNRTAPVVFNRTAPVVIERPAPVIVERPAPVIVERPAPVYVNRTAPVIVERPAPVKFERPAPIHPGIIYGLDEEVEIENCYYEALEEFIPGEVDELVETALVRTPMGPEFVRSHPLHHIAQLPQEHVQIVERCLKNLLIPPTLETGIRIPQVKYMTMDQISTGTFNWPIVRPARVLPGKTVEKTVSIPQMGFVDLCQDHPTDEYPVVIPQVHTVIIQQIVETHECDVVIPQVHPVWISIMGDVFINQRITKSRKVYLKQEWDCTIKCEDTKVHFLKLPQRDVGVHGTVIKNPNRDEDGVCHNCFEAKCAGVTPSLLPIWVNDHSNEVTPVQSVPAPIPLRAAPKPEVVVETKYVEVEVIKEIPCATDPEPTEVHHIKLQKCECGMAAPLMFAEHVDEEDSRSYGGAFPWWALPLILLGLLGLAMLLAYLLCMDRSKKEVVEAPPPKSPTKKFVIEKRTKEEDEEEVEKEIERQLQARAKEKQQPEVRVAAQAPAPANEEIKQAEEFQRAAPAQVVSAAPPKTTTQAQARPESPGGSQRSADRQRSSRGSGSSKKVVKKRIVKMMKQGKLVAEKEEILDEEGNVIRTEIRKEGLSSGSPSRSNA